MLRAVVELSKYILVINIIIYTLISFWELRKDEQNRGTFLLMLQSVLVFINHMTGSLVLLSSRQEITYLFFPLFQIVAIFAYLVLMRAIYPNSNRLVLNHIAMLLSISFVVLTRLSFTRSVRQFGIVAVSMIIAMIIPFFMKYVNLIRKAELLYVIIGIGILSAVLLSGKISNGSKLAFSIMGLTFQPSEFVKIIYVFFVAGILSRARHFGHIVLSAVIAAIHVLILVASRDLGSGLIFFTTYTVMLFVATQKFRYLFTGLFGAGIASVAAYFMFSHVRVRVAAWRDPWSDINATGYQIAQSLFGIGTGGWLGMGIDAGSPSSIPYVEQDFIFSAICEEYGLIFGIGLILICVSLFLELVRISHSCDDLFVKYSVYGLGIVYIVQLFLTIGGNSKFIPLTGVTLPLISYGGSSVLATMIMFSIVQGFQIFNSNMNYMWDDMYDEYGNYIGNYDEDAYYEDDYENQYYDQNNEEYYYEEAPYVVFPKLHMNLIAGVFVVGFIAISAYLAHFIYFDSVEVINNNYNNKRQEILADKTIRGDILSADGEILATTLSNTEERYYPYANVFSHAVGYSTNGRLGVEQSANIYLVSSDISLGNKLQNSMDDEKHMGNTVITTFNSQLQNYAYKELGVYKGAVIITEPETGKVLAMVSKPDFDPNEIDEIWDDIVNDTESSILLNRATQGLYPPGSTFKILTALEYIRENDGEIDSYSYNCNGKFTTDEDRINCYHGSNHGSIDFAISFAKSCNSSFANIGMTLDRDKFDETLNKMLFNKDLPVSFATKSSSYADTMKINDSDLLQMVIGQGETQMTPIHLAMITAAIANDGEMMVPYTIERVETANGSVVKQFSPKSKGQVMSVEEAQALKQLMTSVVEKGTATSMKSEFYSAAGKTGSAEYTTNSDSHAWFTGFTYDTEYPVQITVIMEGAGSGGEYAVPVARRILDKFYELNN